jgi:hypothetical protein
MTHMTSLQCRKPPKTPWTPTPEDIWAMIHSIKDQAKRREFAIRRFEIESERETEDGLPLDATKH